MADSDDTGRLVVVASWLGMVWLTSLMLGAYAAAFGARWGAYLMLMALFGEIAGHMLVGVTEYRRTMARPWPKVPPIEDDDW